MAGLVYSLLFIVLPQLHLLWTGVAGRDDATGFTDSIIPLAGFVLLLLVAGAGVCFVLDALNAALLRLLSGAVRAWQKMEGKE